MKMFEAVLHSSTGSVSRAKPLIIVEDDEIESDVAGRFKRGRLMDSQAPFKVWGDAAATGSTQFLSELVEASFWVGLPMTSGDSTPEWSPAGAFRPDSLGRIQPNENLLTQLSGAVSPLHVLPGSFETVPVLALDFGDGPESVVTFGRDAFVLPVPAGTDFVDVDLRPDVPQVQAEHRESCLKLNERLKGEVQTFLLWELRSGANTLHLTGVAEGPSRWRRVRLGGTRAGGYLVGRIVMGISKVTSNGQRQDPFAARRRVHRETTSRHVAQICPDLRLVHGRLTAGADTLSAATAAVVTIHGPMQTAMPMAERLRPLIRDGVPVLRFEHDTWLPIGENASELTNEILRVGIRNILLVGHSRGGLVADLAASRLQAEGVKCELVTMGTPFQGTPIIGVIKNGLLGVRTLMGGLRVMPGTGPLIDFPTRMIGFLVRGDLPRGMAAMEPRSDYLQGRSPNWFDACRFGGYADPAGIDDSWGIHFLDGLAHPAFSGVDQHDLVVSARSALNLDAGQDIPQACESDHFSYLLQSEVIDAITTLANRLPGHHTVNAETPTWISGGQSGPGVRGAADAYDW